MRGRGTRHFALLRAINVGGHVVKMERLRDLFTELKLDGVATFIASGNVIFDAPAQDAARLEARIEAHLAGALGYDVATFIRTCDELRAITAHAATVVTGAGTLYVGFLKAAPSPQAVAALQALATEDDLLSVDGRELYWLARQGLGQSRVSGARIEKVLGPATLRNITTVGKLLEKFC